MSSRPTVTALLQARGGVTGRYFGAAFFDSSASALWLATLTWVAAGAHSNVIAGMVMFAGVVPGVLAAGLFSGTLVDNRGADHVVSLTMSARALLMIVWIGVVAWVTSESALLVAAAVVAFLFDGLTGLHAPGVSALTVDLVPADMQVVARLTSTVILRTAQLAGMAIGAFLVAQAHLTPTASLAFAALVVSWLLYNTVRRTLASDGGGRVTGTSTIADPTVLQIIRHSIPGWRVLREDPALLRSVILQGTATTATAAAVTAGLPLRVRDSHLPASTFGWGMALYLAGLLIGSVAGLTTARRLRRPVRVGMAAGLLSGVGLVLIGLVNGRAPLVLGLLAIGCAMGIVGPMLSGYRANRISVLSYERGESVAGRVEAAVTVIQLIEPVGYPLMGFLAAAASVKVGSEIVGGAVVAAALFGLSSRPARHATAESLA